MFKKLRHQITKLFASGGQTFIDLLWPGFKEKNFTELIAEYRNLVYACIDTIAEDVAKYEPIFKRGDNAVPHPFLDILEQPHLDLSKFELFQATQIYLELVGEAYWYVALGEQTRKPKTIDILMPDRMKHVVDSNDGSLKGYTYMINNSTEIPLDLDEVIFFKKFNPANPKRGLGTVQAALLYIDVENNTSLFQRNFMSNQATPSGLVTVKGNVNKEAFDKLKRDWKSNYGGVGNAGKTAFIREADVKFEKIGLSIADLQMDTLKRLSQDDIMKMFRVPHQLLGISDKSGAGGLGRANIEAIEYIFAKRTIEPKLKRLDDIIQSAVKRYYGDDIEVTHETQIPEDEEAELNEIDKGIDRWITRNEARAMEGLDPVDGGNTLFINSMQMPLVSTTPVSPPAAKSKSIKVVMKQSRSQFFEILDQTEAKSAKTSHKRFRKHLEEQEKKVIDKLSKLVGKKKSAESDFAIEIEANKEEITADLFEIFLSYLVKAAESGISFTGKPDITFLLNQATRDAVFNSTERLINSFNDETATLIQKQLAAGIANKESLEELTKRVESIYEEAKGYRAERIARTESHNAINEGVAEGYKQAGATSMIWVTEPPSCEYCEAMNGTEVPIGTPFLSKGDKVDGANGGEFINDYVDVLWANLHPNCDCRLEPKF